MDLGRKNKVRLCSWLDANKTDFPKSSSLGSVSKNSLLQL